MPRRLLRQAGSATAAALLLTSLTGCSLLLIPPPEQDAASPVWNLYFEDAGDVKPRSMSLRWSDEFAREGDFHADSPFHDGGRGFRDDRAGCTVTQWETALTDADVDADMQGGDRAASDELLALELGTTVDDLDEFLRTDTLSLSSAGVIEVSGTWGEDSETETSWLLVARGVERLDVGLVTAIDCDGDESADDFYQDLRREGLDVDVSGR